MNNWRIYRLPGSREIWHIDAGPGTQIFNVHGYRAEGSYSRDIGGCSVPRAWIQVENQELHIVNGFAIFRKPEWQKDAVPNAATSVEGRVSECAAARE